MENPAVDSFPIGVSISINARERNNHPYPTPPPLFELLFAESFKLPGGMVRMEGLPSPWAWGPGCRAGPGTGPGQPGPGPRLGPSPNAMDPIDL